MPKALLVEDNARNGKLLARRLTRRGHVVVLARDGQHAVNLALSETRSGGARSTPARRGWRPRVSRTSPV